MEEKNVSTLGGKVMDKVEKSKTEEQEHYEKLAEEERLVSKRAGRTAQILDELLPPVIKDDGFGNEMPHVLVNGEYIPKPLADVTIQEKKLVMEYRRLEELKEEASKYKIARNKAKKDKEKNN